MPVANNSLQWNGTVPLLARPRVVQLQTPALFLIQPNFAAAQVGADRHFDYAFHSVSINEPVFARLGLSGLLLIEDGWELANAALEEPLAGFELNEAEIFESSVGEYFPTAMISPDLHQPLFRTNAGGMVFQKRGEETTPLQLPKQERVDKDGFRKSYTEIKDRGTVVRDVMSFWDMLRPLLEAPLRLGVGQRTILPGELYPYQVAGVKFLAERDAALLGDDMGTGKTVQTAVALRLLFQTGAISSCLIVVPLSLLRNWDRELLNWAGNISRVTVVRGSKQQRNIDWQRQAHIYIATYGSIREDLEVIQQHRSFDLVVLDEIQNINNPGTAQTKAVKQLRRKRSWGLSGTPIQNKLGDLESIFEFLRPEKRGIKFTSTIAAGNAIRPMFLRRRKQDVLKELPPIVRTERWLDLTASQRSSYERAEQEGLVHLKELGTDITVQHILVLIGKLKEICNFDPQSGSSCKFEYLKEDIEQAISEDSKCLVFSQYLENGVTELKSRLKQFLPAVISGEVSGVKRDKEVDRLMKDDNCKVLIATPRSGGVGLNLTEANYVFHFDHWWNPAIAKQATDRAHRIGQKKTVFEYHLWVEDTIERRIYDILARKNALYDQVIDSQSVVGETGLTQDELFGLFGLTAPARKSESGLTSKIAALSPRKFEELIEALYSAMGYDVKLTPQSSDGGVDVIAQRTTADAGTERLAIQCKHTSMGASVDRPELNKLHGVIAGNQSFSKGILVTNGRFTAGCQKEASKVARLWLLDGQRLEQMLRQVGIEP